MFNPFKHQEVIRAKKSPERRKEAPLVVENKRLISPGGHFAGNGVYSAEVRLKKDKKKRRIPVVLKEYQEDGVESFSRIAQKYARMKKDKIKVPPTLRFDEKKACSVMTDLNDENRVALSYNNPSALVENRSFETIPGLQKLVTSMITHAIYAAEKGYRLPKDAYMLLMPLNGSEKRADFVIADLDIIGYNDLDTIADPNIKRIVCKNLARTNLTLLHQFFGEFCAYWLKPPGGQECTIESRAMIAEKLKEYGVRFD